MPRGDSTRIKAFLSFHVSTMSTELPLDTPELETTYVSNDRPTDRPTTDLPPTHYLSIRITVPHGDWHLVHSCLHDVQTFISYPHSGSQKDNEHFHLLIPCTDPKYVDRIRKRIKTVFPQRSGNGFLSIKQLSNGILAAIQYCSKELTTPIHSPDSLPWIQSAPAWVSEPKNIGAHLLRRDPRPINPDHHRELTFRNLEKATLRYRQSHGIRSAQLEDTLAAMHADGWRLNIAVIRSGIPATFYDQFTAATQGHSVFTANRFALMRSVENWRVSTR